MKKLFLLSSLVLISACASGQGDHAPSAPQAAAAPSGSQAVVAEVDGEKITEADLDAAVASQMMRMKAQIYEMKRAGLDQLIETKLATKEAKKRGITIDQLMKVEIVEKVGQIPDQEVTDFYNQNKARMGGKTLEEVKGPIKEQLFARKASVYQQNFITRLKDAVAIKINLEAPKVNVSVDDDPMMGNKNAPVTIVEFTDYQCPFCGKARPTVKQLVAEYGDKVHYVLRDFPLDFHPFAKKAAEAAQCAGDQGKYWVYSDELWANQGALEIVDLKKYAVTAKLDQKKFEECLDQGKFSAEVDKDQADGAKAGVSGTPSFFINGQMLSGAQPPEKFKEIIDQILKNGSGKSS